MKFFPFLTCILIGFSVLAGCAQGSSEGTVGNGPGEETAEVFETIPERDRSTSGLSALLGFLASGDAEGLTSISPNQLDAWGIPNAGEMSLEDPWDSFPETPFIPVLLPEDYEGDTEELEDMLANLTYQEFRADPSGFYESIGLELTSEEVKLVTEFAESPEFEALEAVRAPFKPAKTWPC